MLELKLFVVKILFLFLFLLSAFTFVETIIRNNSFSATKKYLAKNKEKVEVLVLGTSHMKYAINYKYFDFVLASLAHGGSDIKANELLFKKYFSDFPKLKIVLIELSQSLLEKANNDKWEKNPLFHIYYNIDNYSNGIPFTDHFLLTSAPKHYLDKFYDNFFHKELVEVDEYGFKSYTPIRNNKFGNLNLNVDILDSKGERMIQIHNKIKNKNNFKNIKRLINIVDICKKMEVKVVFVSPPKFHTYNDNLMLEHQLRRQFFLDKYKGDKDIYFWNYERKYEKERSYFRNENHTNPTGAEVFSKELNTRLQELI